MDISARINQLRQTPPEQLLTRAGAVVPPYLVVVLVLALGWKLAEFTWLVMPRSDAVAVAPIVTPATAVQREAGSELARIAREIASRHLFGDYAAPPAGAGPDIDIEDLEDTKLNLKLLGTIPIAGGDPKESMAIIQDESGENKLYLVGDPVASGTALFSVYPEEVVLDRNGEKERLRLPEASEQDAGASRRSSRSRRTATPTRRAAAAQSVRQLTGGAQKLTDLIRPQPVFADGRQLGYRVYPGRRRQDFVRLGLKPGDLVTEINGTTLDDPAKGLEIFKALEETAQVSVTVERNGESQVLVLDTQIFKDGDESETTELNP